MEELARRRSTALRDGRVRFHPRVAAPVAIAGWRDPALEHLASALVGPPLPLWYCPDGHVTCAEPPPERCAECGDRARPATTDVLDTWFSSALWPFATLGWPDDTPELRRSTPATSTSTAREIIRLWENRMILAGPRAVRRPPVPRRDHHSTVLAPDGRRMSKSLGTGIDPLDVIDAARRRCDALRALKMSSTQDVRFSYGAIEEGRKLANKLWNVSRLVLAAGGTPIRGEAARARGALDPRADRRRAGRGRERPDGVRLLAAVAGALPPHLRRLLRLVRRGDQATAPRGRRRRRRDRARRARAAAGAAPPGHAARDRGDLVAPPRPRGAADRVAVARARRPLRGATRTRSSASQDGGARPSGGAASASTLDGDEQRIFEAVVRPDRLEGERQRGGRARAPAQGDRRARRRCSRTSASSPTRRPRSSRPSARSSSATGASSTRSAAELASTSLEPSPWPEDFGLGRMRALLARARRPAARATRRSTSSARTASRRRRARPRRFCAREGLAPAPTSRRTSAAGASASAIGGEEADFERALARVRPAAEAVGATQFEALTAAALAAFADGGVDVAVVEAGLGGRHDATNVLDARVVVLTNVALEHTEVLGETREQIAREKLAVVQAGATVVLGEPEWRATRARAAARRRDRRRRRQPRARARRPAFLGATVEPRCRAPCARRAGSSAAASRSRSGTVRTTPPASRWLARRGCPTPVRRRRLDPRRQGRRRDARRARAARRTRSSRPTSSNPRALAADELAAPRRAALRATSRPARPAAARRRARALAGPTAPSSSPARSIFSPTSCRAESSTRTMTKAGERLSVFAFAAVRRPGDRRRSRLPPAT